MSGHLLSGAVLVAILVGCAPRPTPDAPAPPPRDLVLLAADPSSVNVGHLVVTTPAGAVELTGAGESTTIDRGQAPGAVVVLGDGEIQNVFGSALAVIPEAARRFNLYFPLAGDVLTPESTAVLVEVLAIVRARVAPEVSVIGHTDTTGAADANMALGLQRAALIRDLLSKGGVDSDLIDIVSHGETDLLVPTKDNTAEPRNRRVEVSVR